jgi:hypothetical protein
MSEAEGRAAHAHLVVRDREPSLELVGLERAAELLFAYGPEVEVSPPAVLYVELGRSRAALRRRFGRADERELLERLLADLRAIGHVATAALADDPDTARTFAEHLARSGVAARGGPRAEGAGPSGGGRARSSGRGRRAGAPVREGADALRGQADGEADAAARGGAGRGPPGRREPAPRDRETSPPDVWVIPPGRGRAALARLPAGALTWTDRASDPEGQLRKRLHAAVEALAALGITDVGGVRQLSPRELGSRFGEAGVRLADRARGARQRPLRRYVPPERLEEEFELDTPTEALEPVLFVLRRLFHRLEARLSARQRAAAALTLEFLVEPGLERAVPLDAARAASSKRREAVRVGFARPTRSAETLFSVVSEKIGGQLPGAVLAVRAVAEQPERDRGAQLDLFSRRTQKAETLGELVGRLGAALGDAAVFSPRLVDTHRPEEGWTPERFRVDAALAPLPRAPRPPPSRPAPAVVASEAAERPVLPRVDDELSVVSPQRTPEAASETAPAEAWPKPRPRRPDDETPPPLPPRPLELLPSPEPATFHDQRRVLAWRGQRLAVRSASGREHLRAEWWRPDRLERDYLTVETEDGRWLWVYATPEGATFVHGLFD